MARERNWTSTGPNPVANHARVTPSDSVILDPAPRTIVVEDGEGTIVIEDETGTCLAYAAWAGRELPLAALRVRVSAVIDGETVATTEGLSIYAWW
jgi:hypothetical protein